MTASDADWPYVASPIGWVAPCTTVGHERRLAADVPVVLADGETGRAIRLCRDCQDGLLRDLRRSLPRKATP